MAGYFPSRIKSDLPDYSTSEVKTGQKWIDGKDIYMKTLSDQPVSSGNTTITFGVTTERLLDIEGFGTVVVGGVDTYFYPLPYIVGTDTTWSIYLIDPSYGGITIKRGSAINVTKVTLTIFYTKP